MPFIGNTTGTEMMEHRISHTGDGTRTVFTVNYSDDSVSVYLNGVKMVHTSDYTTNATGTNITFIQAPANGDSVDIVGLNFITDLARSSYLRETFTATAAQTDFTLNTNIDGTTKLNIHLNGYRLSEAIICSIVIFTFCNNISQRKVLQVLILVHLLMRRYHH